MRAWRYVAWTSVAIIGIPLIALLCRTRVEPGRIWCQPVLAVHWGPSRIFHTYRAIQFGRNGASFPISGSSRMEIILCTWTDRRAAHDEWLSGHQSLRRTSRKSELPMHAAE